MALDITYLPHMASFCLHTCDTGTSAGVVSTACVAYNQASAAQPDCLRSAAQAWNPPTRSVARVRPNRCRVCAARLEL